MAKINLYRVLSVDFDVFQNIPSKKLLEAYPDGFDVSTDISCQMWKLCYRNPEKASMLAQISADECRLRGAMHLIEKSCNDETPIMIVNSHKKIYDWIFEHYNAKNYQGLQIVNLDMHHDMFNENSNLGCGNWISHVKKREPNLAIEWVCNPISKEVYGLNSPEFSFINDQIDRFLGTHFDLLFICRSDNWLPPHLDKHFRNFCESILCNHPKAVMETDILKPRRIGF